MRHFLRFLNTVTTTNRYNSEKMVALKGTSYLGCLLPLLRSSSYLWGTMPPDIALRAGEP